MPIYEYRCNDCGETFDRTRSIQEHDADRPACPKCGGERVEQVFTGFFAKTARKS